MRTALALAPRRQADLLPGALLALVNPFAVVFWLSVGGGLLGTFILAPLLWSVLLASLAACGRRLMWAAGCRWVNVGAGVALALGGAGLLWQTLAARGA